MASEGNHAGIRTMQLSDALNRRLPLELLATYTSPSPCLVRTCVGAPSRRAVS